MRMIRDLNGEKAVAYKYPHATSVWFKDDSTAKSSFEPLRAQRDAETFS